MRISEQALTERKDTIIHTAYRMFCEFGVDGITLAEIAKESKVGASAIYRYFETKANLLLCTQTLLWEEIVAQISIDGSEYLSAAQNGFQELAILLYRFKALYKRYGSYLLFANDYKMYMARNHIKLSKQVYDQLMEPVCQLFQNALRRGHADGSISRRESVEDQFFAIWGVMRSFAEQIVIYDKMYDGENPWESRFDLVYHYTLRALKREEAGEEPRAS